MVAIIPIKKFKQMDKARQRFFSNMSKISDSFAGEDLEKLDDILAEATQAAKQIERRSYSTQSFKNIIVKPHRK